MRFRRTAALVECGDWSLLLRRRLVAVEPRCGSGHAGTPPLARAVNAPSATHDSPNSTATSRLGKAVTSHRTGVWTFCADVRWPSEPRQRSPERVMFPAAFWLAAHRGSLPRSLPPVPFVPEARKKLAGGEAQRNHRKTRTEERCAPAGRESREIPPSRLATATPDHRPTSRLAYNPAGARRPGGRGDGRSAEEASRVGPFVGLSRPAGAHA